MTETTSAECQNQRKRPNRVHVRFTPEEYGRLQKQAQIVNKKPASLLRGLALEERFKAVPRLPEDVYRAVRSLAGNLNQLAHQANLGHADPRAVEALRVELSELLKAILN